MLFDLMNGVDTWTIATQSIAHKLIPLGVDTVVQERNRAT